MLPTIRLISPLKQLLFLCGVMALVACSAQEEIAVSTEKSEAGEPVTELFLFADERDLERLFSRNPRSDARIEGYVRIGENGRIRTLRQGFRFRGNTSRYHPKKSYNIRFEHEQPFLFDSPRMNLNAMYTDPSGMRERLAWDMFAELDRPASKPRYFALYINRGFEGLGIHVQRVDEVLLRQNDLDPNGTLVRDLTRRRAAQAGLDRRSIFGYDLRQQTNPDAFLSTMFDSRWTPDYGRLTDLINWVHDTPAGPEFETGFRQRIDAGVFTDWLAIHYLIGDVDAFGDDYWLHIGGSSDSKWIVIPWDHDLSFGKNERDNLQENREMGQFGRGISQLNEFFAYEYPIDDAGWDNALVSRYLETEGLYTMLTDRLTELMTERFTYDYFERRIAQHAEVIRPWIERNSEDDFRLHQRQHHGESGHFDYHLETLLDFVWLRYAYLERQINPVSGEAYQAEITISEPGKYALTDAKGWTIATLEADYVNGANVTVSIRSEAADIENGIRQKWYLNTEGEPGSISGKLTLYYRNDIAPDGKANWYPGPEAIGRQWDLMMMRDDETLQSRVNPYSNKVTASMEIHAGQTRQFQLRW